MANKISAQLITLISDNETASDEGERKVVLKGKRKQPAQDFEEKIVWDADSDDGLQAKSKSKSKRRKSGRPATKREKGKEKEREKQAKDKEVEPLEQVDDYDVAGAPDYLRERRREFDQGRERLREAGLLLPPRFEDAAYFSEDDDRGDWPTRPQFEDSTGVKPCRPYQDVEMEYSGGIIPASIAQYLRDYQIVGVKFLHRLFVYQLGGILGDDMGLGKTVQVAAFLTAAFGKTGDARDDKRMRKMREEQVPWYPRVLIICPGSLFENWRNELNRWGWWHIELFHGSNVEKEDALGAARAGMLEIMITTYQTYKNHASSINTVKWDAVIADECHAMKRRSAEITKEMDQINALCRIGLTGTAIQNSYSELWTLLNWTNPGHFGTAGEWERTIAEPLRVGQSHDASLVQLSKARVTAKKLVTNLLPRFFLRRLKTLISHQLPKKSDRVVFCPLTNDQRQAYKNFIERPEIELLRTLSDPCECGSGAKQGWCCKKILPDGRSWQSIIFPSVITLQKLANHLTLLVPSTSDPSDKQKREMETLQSCCPDTWEYLYHNRDAIVNLANPEFCGKWKVLKKLLKFWHDNGDKVLVFSHSVRLLRILQYLFNNTNYNVTYLDGSLSYQDRQKAVDDFNSDPNQFVFIISTKAGGVGLNITSANKVVIVDPHWNPAYDLQAQDRAYRIGQRRDVDVFRLVASGTIEEIVYARQIYKQQQANIGYTASSERRYFKGVQEDMTRKGEIFGLHNLFTFREDQLVIRDIVNKTNIAEAKAGSGIALAGVDMEQAADDDYEVNRIKQEGAGSEAVPTGGFGSGVGEDGRGMAQLAAAFLTSSASDPNRNGATAQQGQRTQDNNKPRSDAVQAILAAAGVEYSHENSEVIGTSKIEEKISRAAEMAACTGENSQEETGNTTPAYGGGGGGGGSSSSTRDPGALFAASLLESITNLASAVTSGGSSFPANSGRIQYRYNPPEEVMRRQFCTMAREFGFADATEFALVVESWTQEQRRNCLETFYKIREGKLLAEEAVSREVGEGEGEDGGNGGDVEMEEGDVGVDVKDDEDGEYLDVESGVGQEEEEQRDPGSDVKSEHHSNSPQDIKSESGHPNHDITTGVIKTEEKKEEEVKTEASSALETKIEASTAGQGKRSSVFIYDSGDEETDEL